jgi:hypothetical protein
MMLMESLDATKLMPEQRHHAAMPAHPRIAADSGSIDAIDTPRGGLSARPAVRSGY